MTYVTIPQIAKAARRSLKTVRAALKKNSVPMEKESNRLGYRVETTKAQRFLNKQWPGARLEGGAA